MEGRRQQLEKSRKFVKPPDILSGASTKARILRPPWRAPISGTFDKISETRLVPLAGLEPARPCGHQILSQA
jgi:hypothetical protein